MEPLKHECGVAMIRLLKPNGASGAQYDITVSADGKTT